MEKEIWKGIVGYENLYEVSNLGNVKSLVRSKSIKENKVMKPTAHCTGYQIIGLCLNKKQTLFRLHRIVALHFCEKKDGCDIVNHKNGIKNDNRASNLEWTTVSGNTSHSFRMGFQEVRRGEKSNFSVLSESDVLKIREKFKQGGYTKKQLGTLFNVSQTCIHHVVNRINWKHI